MNPFLERFKKIMHNTNTELDRIEEQIKRTDINIRLYKLRDQLPKEWFEADNE